MSHLPGAMTKQILSAPPRISRSTRYSLTAHGRATPASVLLPTGSNSLEKARGWMRVPRPAAGTIPHISGLRHCTRLHRALDEALELARAPVRCVLLEDALARRAADPGNLAVVDVQGGKRVVGALGEENFLARGEELFQARPRIA